MPMPEAAGLVATSTHDAERKIGYPSALDHLRALQLDGCAP
jgi:hypothetical protein